MIPFRVRRPNNGDIDADLRCDVALGEIAIGSTLERYPLINVGQQERFAPHARQIVEVRWIVLTCTTRGRTYQSTTKVHPYAGA